MSLDGHVIPTNNKRFEPEFCTVAYWRNNEIFEEKLFYDLLGLLRQARRSSNNKDPSKESASGLTESGSASV